MADVRYYREAKRTVLGNNQKAWLSATMNQNNNLKILCAGSTLSDGDCWKDYGDYQWLQGQNFKNFIVLSGDIHKNKIVKHKSSDGSVFPEFISSGAASPDFLIFNGACERWGLIDVKGNSVANLTVSLFREAKVEHQWP
jgi:phosphodiesterase/alkaline phosphatase D-like protein